MQSSEKSIENVVPSESVETSHSPPKVRRSTRSTKGIPPMKYGSVTSHKVNVSANLQKWMSCISKKSDVIYDKFDCYYSLIFIIVVHIHAIVNI